MHVPLKIITSGEYFSQTEREIDWEEESDKVSIKQSELIDKILATEVSIFLLRRANGIDDGVIDTMVMIRGALIENYEEDYEPYVKYNDYY